MSPWPYWHPGFVQAWVSPEFSYRPGGDEVERLEMEPWQGQVGAMEAASYTAMSAAAPGLAGSHLLSSAFVSWYA